MPQIAVTGSAPIVGIQVRRVSRAIPPGLAKPVAVLACSWSRRSRPRRTARSRRARAALMLGGERLRVVGRDAEERLVPAPHLDDRRERAQGGHHLAPRRRRRRGDPTAGTRRRGSAAAPCASGIPERTPNARASYDAVATTWRGRRGLPSPPTTTGRPPARVGGAPRPRRGTGRDRRATPSQRWRSRYPCPGRDEALVVGRRPPGLRASWGRSVSGWRRPRWRPLGRGRCAARLRRACRRGRRRTPRTSRLLLLGSSAGTAETHPADAPTAATTIVHRNPHRRLAVSGPAPSGRGYPPARLAGLVALYVLMTYPRSWRVDSYEFLRSSVSRHLCDASPVM